MCIRDSSGPLGPAPGITPAAGSVWTASYGWILPRSGSWPDFCLKGSPRGRAEDRLTMRRGAISAADESRIPGKQDGAGEIMKEERA